MGAPPAKENTQRNDAEAHRSLPGRSRFPPRIHLMAATMVSVRYYTTSPELTRMEVFGAV